MAIGKGEIILGVIEAFDEIEKLRHEQAMKPAAKIIVSDCGTDGEPRDLTLLEQNFLQIGKKSVYKECTYSWNEARAKRDEETGEISVTTYKQWLKEKVGAVPSYMSKDDFYVAFADMLKDEYESEKQEAIAKLAVTGEDDG